MQSMSYCTSWQCRRWRRRYIFTTYLLSVFLSVVCWQWGSMVIRPRCMHGHSLLSMMWHGLCVCLLITTESTTKKDEPMKMQLGVWTLVVPGNHARIPTGEGAILGGAPAMWPFFKILWPLAVKFPCLDFLYCNCNIHVLMCYLSLFLVVLFQVLHEYRNSCKNYFICLVILNISSIYISETVLCRECDDTTDSRVILTHADVE